ncbi:MAG: hypothetical protein HYR97_06270 [Candidatus Melainabacteria bacterium]|nr:hypothetical protein [Candidatus Melainabacteria bacterium]
MIVIGIDRAVPLGSIQRQVRRAQCRKLPEQEQLEKQWAANREAARRDPNFDVTQHFGHLYNRFGIEGFGLG